MSVAALFPCISDATHLRGLAALRRRFPRSWADRMRRSSRAVGPEATVAELMQAGGMGMLLPRAPTEAEAARLKKLRHCARRLVHAYGGMRVGDLDEAWLRRQRPHAGDGMDVGRDVATAAFTLLRKAAYRAQEWGGQVRVRARLSPMRRPTMGPPPGRPVAPWSTLEPLVAQGTLRIRAIAALQMHAGASSTRVLGLRVGDIDLDQGTAWCRVRGRGGWQRVPYALPPDAVRAIRPWWRRMRARGPDAPLFPQRGHPGRPTRSVNRALRRETRRLGLPPTTLAAVRRFGQAGLRGVGAVRAQVRGSARRPATGRGISARELERQRSAWAWQLGAEERRVPLRAPRRCHADEPERRRRQPRRWEPGQHPATPLQRRSPWAVRERPRSERRSEREAPPPAHVEPLPEHLPTFTPLPAGPMPIVVRQRVPTPPSPEDLITAGLLGASVGGIAGLLAPRVVEGALEVGAEALLALARQVHGTGDDG